MEDAAGMNSDQPMVLADFKCVATSILVSSHKGSLEHFLRHFQLSNDVKCIFRCMSKPLHVSILCQLG